MAFSDPQSVTISGSAISLPRTGDGMATGEFTSNDGLTQVTVSHQNGGKRVRRQIKLTNSKVAPDPLISDRNIRFSMSAYVVVDTPVTGYTVAEAQAVVLALASYLSASSGASIGKLLGGEH